MTNKLRRSFLAGRRPHAHRAPPGSAPDTLLASVEAAATTARLMQFDAASCDERILDDEGVIAAVRSPQRTQWIDIQGLANIQLIDDLGQAAGMHPLTVADIVHTHQRPKVDIYEDHLVVVMRMPHREGKWRSEQVTLVVRNNCVISFQERAGDCFDPVRERLRAGLGRIRTAGADYLAYTLIDALIDSFFPILEAYGEQTELIEERVLSSSAPAQVKDIHLLKRDLLELRHAVWPLRELVANLLREDTPVIRKATRVYLRDCSDHAFQLMDILEIYREIASGLIDLHLSSVSNRMNEAMKVLTIIATIFIPMTFIAGVYGMNFDRASAFNMPELSWRYGYVFALGLMAAAATGIILLLRRNGWIGKRRE